jgi:hypothetical protein
METLEFTLAQLISLARNFNGSQPSFRISFCRKHVEITDACSGFLKVLMSDDKVFASFHNGVIQVQYFSK